MNTVRLTTAQAIVEFLKQQFVERDGQEHRIVNGVFGIFGHGNVAGLGQALNERGGKELPFYQGKNEQAMVHSAIAFAKTKRRLSAMACTTSIGPGATNLVTGAATATINRIPVLLLPGDIFSNRAPDPVLQQLEHPTSMDISVNDCLKPVSKFWDRINRPEQILKSLPEAMRVLTDPAETGAVTICLPQDVQAEAYDFPKSFFDKKVYRQFRQDISKDALKMATELIQQSERPLFVIGGGIHFSEAEPALAKLCSATGIPAAFSQAGTGGLLGQHAQSLGALGVTGTSVANQIAEKADLVISVGTRLSDFTTASHTIFKNKKVRHIHLNINSKDAHKLSALPLTGDARQGLEAIALALKDFSVSAVYQKEIQTAKSEWNDIYQKVVSEKSKSTRLSQPKVIQELNTYFDSDCVVVHAAGGIPGDIHKLWQAKSSTDYHSEYGYSCMGYEIAGALGVKLADPKKRVFAFLGDGSYLMLSQEIVTAVQLGQSITVVLNDNHGFQCIKNLQEACGGNNFGNDFQDLKGEHLPIDFVKNAESLGAKTWTALSTQDLRTALKESGQHIGVSLIYVPIATDVKVPGFAWWDVPMSEVSELAATQKKRKDYENKKLIQKELL